MKTTAAVLVETGHPLELADLEIPRLQPGQVLVEIAHSGVCHTQLLECRGYRGEDPFLPHCLGHEGSGVVQEVGADVTKCQPGDHVILSWIKGDGANVPGTVYDWDGKKVNAGGVTTFSYHSVVSENRLTVVPKELNLRQAALLGCAIPTGAGTVFNTAGVEPGDSVAVFGVGGIGLCAVAAAAIAGASPVIAVDLDQQRLTAAKSIGATHLIQPPQDDLLECIGSICSSGLDFAVEASGRPEVMQLALQSVKSQGGTAVIAGNAPHGEQLVIDPQQLNQGKRLLGTWGGDNAPSRDFPRYCELVLSGELNVSPLMSRSYTLEEIETALSDLESRKAVRPIIDMPSSSAGK